MKIVNEHTPGSAQFKDVPFGGVFYFADIAVVTPLPNSFLTLK